MVSNFIVQALKEEPLTVCGDGLHTRSFCYVGDMVDGLTRLMESPSVTGPINLGNPHEITVLELAQRILAETGSRSDIVFKEMPEDDPRRRCPDVQKAETELDWKPRTSLEDGLKMTVDHFKRRLMIP